MLKPNDLTKVELLQVVEMLAETANEYYLDRALGRIEMQRNDAHYARCRKLIDEEQKHYKASEALDRFRQLAKADKDGRLAVLLCKVGDTVYFTLLGKIIEKQVFSIVSFSNSTRIYCSGTSEYFRPEDIGKTFFLTREEAEKALEAKKDD